MSPASVARALETMMHKRGVGWVAECPVFGVVSVSTGLTVWTDGRVLLWHHDGVPDAYPTADIEGAAERLAALAVRTGSPGTV
jgi:hypothetical protein